MAREELAAVVGALGGNSTIPAEASAFPAVAVVGIDNEMKRRAVPIAKRITTRSGGRRMVQKHGQVGGQLGGRVAEDVPSPRTGPLARVPSRAPILLPYRCNPHTYSHSHTVRKC